METQNPNINVNWVPGITLEEMEKQCILAAYKFYRGNKTQTSIALGIAIRTLDHKLERYEADRVRESERFDSDKYRKEVILARMRGVPYTGPIPTPKESAQGVPDASAGIHMEPAIDSPAQSAMPMPQREKVQSVPPRHSSQSSKGGRR